MGIWDAFTDIVEAVTPWSVVEAEAPAEPKVRLFLTHFLSPINCVTHRGRTRPMPREFIDKADTA